MRTDYSCITSVLYPLHGSVHPHFPSAYLILKLSKAFQKPPQGCPSNRSSTLYPYYTRTAAKVNPQFCFVPTGPQERDCFRLCISPSLRRRYVLLVLNNWILSWKISILFIKNCGNLKYCRKNTIVNAKLSRTDVNRSRKDRGTAGVSDAPG